MYLHISVRACSLEYKSSGFCNCVSTVIVFMDKITHSYVSECAAPGAGEGTSSGGDPTHPPRKKRARVDPTVESVS